MLLRGAAIRGDVDVPWRRIAATPRPRRGSSAATWIFRGDVSRRGDSTETCRGAAATTTWILRGDVDIPRRRVAAPPRARRGSSVESRRRRGRDVDIPWRRRRDVRTHRNARAGAVRRCAARARNAPPRGPARGRSRSGCACTRCRSAVGGRAAPAAARSRRRPRASRLSSGLPTNSPFLLPKRRRAVAAIGAERARAFAGTQGRVTCSNYFAPSGFFPR